MSPLALPKRVLMSSRMGCTLTGVSLAKARSYNGPAVCARVRIRSSAADVKSCALIARLISPSTRADWLSPPRVSTNSFAACIAAPGVREAVCARPINASPPTSTSAIGWPVAASSCVRAWARSTPPALSASMTPRLASVAATFTPKEGAILRNPAATPSAAAGSAAPRTAPVAAPVPAGPRRLTNPPSPSPKPVTPPSRPLMSALEPARVRKFDPADRRETGLATAPATCAPSAVQGCSASNFFWRCRLSSSRRSYRCCHVPAAPVNGATVAPMPAAISSPNPSVPPRANCCATSIATPPHERGSCGGSSTNPGGSAGPCAGVSGLSSTKPGGRDAMVPLIARAPTDRHGTPPWRPSADWSPWPPPAHLQVPGLRWGLSPASLQASAPRYRAP